MKPFSLLPSETIRNHQTNNSTAKTAFQFSKEKRFPDPNPEYIYFYLDAKLHSILMIVNSQIERLHLDMERNLILLKI